MGRKLGKGRNNALRTGEISLVVRVIGQRIELK